MVLNTQFVANEDTINYINSTKNPTISSGAGETNLRPPKQFTKSVKAAANGKKSLFQEI